MKIIIAEETLKSKIKIENDHLDHYSGEDLYVLRAKFGNKTIGTLEYGVYQEQPNVKMIEVDKDWRRMNIATDLIKHLQSLYPNTEIELGYATDDGGKFINSLNRKFHPNPEYKKLSERLSKILSEIDRIKALMDKEDYSQSEKLNDLHDEKYEIQDQLREISAGKWLIEGLVTELMTKKNFELKDSAVSKIYVGQNWVKKVKNRATRTGSTFSKEELLQYRIMQENQSAGIFPPTLVKSFTNKEGLQEPVILQKRVDVHAQVTVYHRIMENIKPINFKMLIEVIAECGISASMREEIKEAQEMLNKELGEYFNRYVELANKLNPIRKQYGLQYRVDFNSGNFGFLDGKIVIIDFSNPYLKTS